MSRLSESRVSTARLNLPRIAILTLVSQVLPISYAAAQ